MKRGKKSGDTGGDIEEIDRKSPFTRNWNQKISETESDALPIKSASGKVVRVKKINTSTADDSVLEDTDNDDNSESETVQKKKPKKKKKNDSISIEESGATHEKKNNQCKTLTFTTKSQHALERLKKKIAEICNAIIGDPTHALKRKTSTSNNANGKNEGNAKEKGPSYHMSDLIDIMVHTTDAEEFEMAMLSTLLVFRDICPGYRIRSPEEYDKEVQLKKETKSLRDFEVAFLVAYQKYLSILEGKVQTGLGSAKKEVAQWGFLEKLGLSALRCQCELLRSLHYFNFRANLLKTIIARASQPEPSVSSLCCDSLIHLFKHDPTSEPSYEAIKIIASAISTTKCNSSSAGLISTLQHCKIAIHADQGKEVRQKLKRERRKRKRNDDAESGLFDATAAGEKNSKLRYQADSLHELSLIYFRIIKAKVGFGLLPTALTGLGRITHLINIDTVEDLVAVMRGIMESSPPAPLSVQALCIHCSLKTLSGPGEELKIDDEYILIQLHCLLRELPYSFDRWDAILECIDMCLLQKREERNYVVVSFVRLLLLTATQLTGADTYLALPCFTALSASSIEEVNDDGAGAETESSGSAQPKTGLSPLCAPALLAMAHAILLRYPRARQGLEISQLRGDGNSNGNVIGNTDGQGSGRPVQEFFQEDGEVCDMAMQALQASTEGVAASFADYESRSEGDGSWVLALLRSHVDPRYTKSVAVLSSSQLLPLPLRIGDAVATSAGESVKHWVTHLDVIMQSIPKTLPCVNSHKSQSNSNSSGKGSSGGGSSNNGSNENSGSDRTLMKRKNRNRPKSGRPSRIPSEKEKNKSHKQH